MLMARASIRVRLSLEAPNATGNSEPRMAIGRQTNERRVTPMMNDILSLVDLVAEEDGMDFVVSPVGGNSGISAGCGSGASANC
jgi:hypothetical protein